MPGQSITRGIHEREIVSLLATPARAPQDYVSQRIPSLARLDRRCLAKVKATTLGTSYARGTVLFAEEHRPDGVYVILEGRAKLSVSSPSGRSLVLGFFGPGTVLGLEGAILGGPYMATAEIVEPTKAAFMARRDLLRHLGQKSIRILVGIHNFSHLPPLRSLRLARSRAAGVLFVFMYILLCALRERSLFVFFMVCFLSKNYRGRLDETGGISILDSVAGGRAPLPRIGSLFNLSNRRAPVSQIYFQIHW